VNGLLTIGPKMLEQFPVSIPPLVGLAASVILMGPDHCHFLALGLQKFKESPEELQKPVRFSQSKLGCVW
jgi:hypothetical protein